MSGRRSRWRVAPGFASYEVSEDGAVRRTIPARGAKVGRVLKPVQIGPYYVGYKFYRPDGRQCAVYAHHLVAQAFLPPKPGPGYEIAHNDGNHRNNHYTNLRWATHAENMADMVTHGRSQRGERNKWAKITNRQAAEIRTRYKAGGVQQVELAREYGISAPAVCRIVNGQGYGQKVAG